MQLESSSQNTFYKASNKICIKMAAIDYLRLGLSDKTISNIEVLYRFSTEFDANQNILVTHRDFVGKRFLKNIIVLFLNIFFGVGLLFSYD